MTRYASTLFALMIGCVLLVSTADATERLNILSFFADDRSRYATAYAHPENPTLNDVITTPNIDRVAREGVLFRNAFVPVASCGP